MVSLKTIVVLAILQSFALSLNDPLDARPRNGIEVEKRGKKVPCTSTHVAAGQYVFSLSIYDTAQPYGGLSNSSKSAAVVPATATAVDDSAISGTAVAKSAVSGTAVDDSAANGTAATGTAADDSAATGTAVDDSAATGTAVVDSAANGTAVVDTTVTGTALADNEGNGTAITDNAANGTPISTPTSSAPCTKNKKHKVQKHKNYHHPHYPGWYPQWIRKTKASKTHPHQPTHQGASSPTAKTSTHHVTAVARAEALQMLEMDSV
ncbi:hypothetical protein MMC07_000610 [Pseudocyphellaria aurata]|nr:hypothetical protein [Pseudocyphellaria aurata]